MNKSILCVLLFLIFATENVTAQLDKSDIGVMPFTYSDKRYAKNSKELHGIVVDVLSRKRYMHLLDRTKTAQIKKELNLQKGMDYLNGKTVAQGKAVGADIILVGDLTNMEVIKVKAGVGKMAPPGRGGKESKLDKDDKASSHKLMITFSLQAFNVETGELLDNKRFQISAMDANHMDLGGFYETESTNPESSVIAHASGTIEKEVEAWLDEVAPAPLKIVTIDEEDKKGYPSLISIIGGEDAGLSVGDRLVLYELTKVEIGDKILTRKEDIAVLKVKELQGDFTQCKVVSGEEDVKEKWKNENLKLLVDHNGSKFPMPPHKR